MFGHRHLSSLLAVALLAASPAIAGSYDPPGRHTRGVEGWDESEGANMRYGVSCLLNIGRYSYDGLCNIGRRPGGLVTVVKAGSRTYRIVRNEEDPKGEADFYQGDTWIDNVFSQGSCWRGSKVDFCAR